MIKINGEVECMLAKQLRAAWSSRNSWKGLIWMPTAHSLNWDRFWNNVLWEKMLSLMYITFLKLNSLFCSIFECWGLNGYWIDATVYESGRKVQEMTKIHFILKFNRITELDVVCIAARRRGLYCVRMAQCVPNVSVCCMNYQWEDGCGLAELKRFRLRCPLTAHWFDISIIDSKGDSDSWAAQSQLFSWFEASWTCTQVEGLEGDY